MTTELLSPEGENRRLVDHPRRQRFSAEYKLRVLREVEKCSRPGEIGALLPREGLYTSHLTRIPELGSLRADR